MLQAEHSDINFSNMFLDLFSRGMEIRAKIKKWDLIKLKKVLQSKRNRKQNEKTTYGLGENICKQCH